MNKYKSYLLIFLLILSIIFLAPVLIINTDKNYETTFEINITRDFQNQGAKYSYFEYYFPESYSNANSDLFVQTYSSNIIFKPEPKEKGFFLDNLQNKLVRFVYESNYGFSTILKFKGLLRLKNDKIFFIPFPYNEKWIPDNVLTYLEYPQESALNEICFQIAKNKSNLISILFSFKQFLDNNIKYSSIYSGKTAREILKDKIASKEEILDLYLDFLRILGIPARVSCGIQLPFQFDFKNENYKDKFKIYSGKGVTTCLEIWTKDYGWIYFDPFFYFLSSINNFVKLGHAKYVNQLHYIYLESKSSNISLKENIDINYEKFPDFIIDEIKENFLSNFYILNENYFQLIQINLKENNNELSSEYYSGFDDIENKKLYFSGLDTETEIKVGNNEGIMQNFYLDKDYIFNDLILNILPGFKNFELKIYKGTEINEKYLIYHNEVNKENISNISDKKVKIKLPSLYMKKGLYLIYIFVAEDNKNCTFYAYDTPSFPGFFYMNLILINKRIKTNLVIPIVFDYE